MKREKQNANTYILTYLQYKYKQVNLYIHQLPSAGPRFKLRPLLLLLPPASQCISWV